MSIAERYDAYEIRDQGTYADTWVYGATRDGHLVPEAKRVLGAARRLTDAYNDDYDADENVVAVALGQDAPRAGAACLEHGADVAYVAEHEALTRFNPEAHANMLLEACRRNDGYKDYDLPRFLLFPDTETARLVASTVTAHLDTGLVTDVETLTVTDVTLTHPFKTGGHETTFERVLEMTRRPAHGRSRDVVACLDNEARDFHPQAGLLAPSTGTSLPPDPQRVHQGRILQIPIATDPGNPRITLASTRDREPGPHLETADRIVAVGRGIQANPTKGILAAKDLADAIDGQVAVSRGVLTAEYPLDEDVDELVSQARQIGETGATVRPAVYVAAGIHGAPRHNAGIMHAEQVIAVNENPDAPIREVADVFIQGDLFDVLPRLTRAVRKGERS